MANGKLKTQQVLVPAELDTNKSVTYLAYYSIDWYATKESGSNMLSSMTFWAQILPKTI